MRALRNSFSHTPRIMVETYKIKEENDIMGSIYRTVTNDSFKGKKKY